VAKWCEIGPRLLLIIYSQTSLISHLWDCQNCVILTEVDINRSYHSSPTRSNIKTTAKVTPMNEHILTQ